MANVITSQILMDGPRNLVVRLTGTLDTADVTATGLITLVNLSAVDIAGSAPTRLIVDKITYDVETPISVNLAWDATTDVTFATLTTTGVIDANKYGGIYNTEASGVTGNIMYSTQGYASGTVTFTVLLECRKK